MGSGETLMLSPNSWTSLQDRIRAKNSTPEAQDARQSRRWDTAVMTAGATRVILYFILHKRKKGPLGIVVSLFRPTSRIEGGPHHHVEAERRWRHLWHYFHFWPLVQTLGHGPTVGSVEFLHVPTPRKGSGSTTTARRDSSLRKRVIFRW